MEEEKPTSMPPLSIRWVRSQVYQRISRIGLKTKITFFVIFIVAGVLLIASYLDYHLARKDQINLYVDRNLYIANKSTLRSRTKFFYLANDLVARDYRQLHMGDLTLNDVKICVANPACFNLEQDLPWPWLRTRDLNQH
jgi:hypothetical protein